MGRSETIRDLNDRFQQGRQGGRTGRTLVTQGLLARGEGFVSQVIAGVKAFDAVSADGTLPRSAE